MKRSSSLLLLIAGVTLLVAGAAEACPTCKDGLAAADSQGANIARGYFYSILLMLAMPFTLAGSFGLYVWREFRRQAQTEQPGTPPLDGGGTGSHPAGFASHSPLGQSSP